jgi:hypothetical protein
MAVITIIANNKPPPIVKVDKHVSKVYNKEINKIKKKKINKKKLKKEKQMITCKIDFKNPTSFTCGIL